MIFFVYIIANERKSKFITYVGYTNDLNKRLELHNKGKGAKFTKGKTWKLIYFEKYKTKKDAMKREYYIKKNRKLRQDLINKFK